MDLKVSATDCNMEVIAMIYFYSPRYTGFSFHPVVEKLTSPRPQVFPFPFVLLSSFTKFLSQALAFCRQRATSSSAAFAQGKPHTAHRDSQRLVHKLIMFPGDLISVRSCPAKSG